MNFGKWIGFIALILSLYILWSIRQIVLLLLTAVLLANALNVLVKKLQDWSLKLGNFIGHLENLPSKFSWLVRLGRKPWILQRGYAVLLAILIALSIAIAFFFLIVPPFIDQFQELSLKISQGIEELSSLSDIWIYNLENRLRIDLDEFVPDIDELIAQLQPLVNELLNRSWTVFSGSLVVALNLLLLLALTLMLLADPQPYRQGFIRLFPSFYRNRIDRILSQCEESLQGWFVGILFNMFVIAICSFIGLLFLKIPLALAQALLAGILTFIPNIGPVLSVIPPMIIALLDEPWKSFAVLILYIIIQQVESHLLTPFVMARQVSLLPAFTLLAQFFFASFFGFLGLLLAVPLTVIGQVWLKEVLIKDVLDQWNNISS